MRSRGATLEQIEEVYRARLDEFVRVAAAVVGEREQARDAVQDAFARAVRKRGTFRGEGTLDGWLWRFVVNAARDTAAAAGPAPADDAGGRRNGYEADAVDEVRRAVAELPERQRLILFLRYYADLDYGTIAEATGVDVGTVGSTLHAAHRTLRRELDAGR